MDRRDFLKNSLMTYAAFALYGEVRSAGLQGRLVEARSTRILSAESPLRPPGDGLIRLPGALEEAAFLAGCIRCNRCQDACEPGAIRFFSEVEGRLMHTPYVDPAIRACTLCMKCTQICPTNALVPMDAQERAKVAMASVALRRDLCLSYKAKRVRDEQALLAASGRAPTESASEPERRGPCGECYMFCPLRERAIKLEPGAFLAPLVFPKHCVGCGLCEEICRVMVRGEPAIHVVPTQWKHES